MRVRLAAGLLLAVAPLWSVRGGQASPAIEAEQARIEAARAAQERAARLAEPRAALDRPDGPSLGPISSGEQPCFPITRIDVEGAEHRRLHWVRDAVAAYRGLCLGSAGLDHLLKSLQAGFLDRGLVTTRAGIPEQQLDRGTLKLRIIPGRVAAVRVNGTDKSGGWATAAPLGSGDLLQLRALEQGLEQLRRVPGRTVEVSIEPGDEVGQSVLAISDKRPRWIGGTVGINNYAGEAVGRWQGSAQLTALDLFGLSEIASLSFNRRVDAPGVPADSLGYAGTLSAPFGWWTVGGAASINRYRQTVAGAFSDFETRGRVDSISVYAERTLFRDQTSRTGLKLGLGRRWSRNFIEDVEIGI